MALLVPDEPARAAATVEGLWAGHDGRGRGRAPASRCACAPRDPKLAGTLSSTAGSIKMESPLRDVAYDKGTLRFRADICRLSAPVQREPSQTDAISGHARADAPAPRPRQRAASPSSTSSRRSPLVRAQEATGPDRPRGAPRASGPPARPAPRARRQPDLGDLRRSSTPPSRCAPRVRSGWRALFGPEHGIWADAQDLVEVEDGRDPAHRPARAQPLRPHAHPHARDAGRSAGDGLRRAGRGLALLHLHLHDAARARGLRAKHGLPMVVLDRPNPLGRRRRGRQRARPAVPLVRGHAPPGRAPRHDRGRAGPALPARARVSQVDLGSCA